MKKLKEKPIEISNKFDVLENYAEKVEDITFKQRPTPPIIVNKIKYELDELTGIIEKHAGNRYYVKFTSENINVYLQKNSTRSNLIQDLNNEKIYYTYTIKKEKKSWLCIDALDITIKTDKLTNELIWLRLQLLQIYKITMKHRSGGRTRVD